MKQSLFLYLGLILLLTMPVLPGARADKQSPVISGIWLPVPELSEPWPQNLDALPLTEAAKTKLQAFDPQRFDSTQFCLPYGTPRNTLNTAPYPIEILQTDEQITFLFDRLGDIRRIFIDGRPQPQDPIPKWMGHSIGRWNNKTLFIETIAMTPESILNDAGLPHSDSMRLEESFALVNKRGEPMLAYELTLFDETYYKHPLTTSRYFRRVPHIEMGEGSGLCLLDQWRRQLETINRTQFRDQAKPKAE